MCRARERTDLYFTASSFDEAIGRQPESDLVRWLSTSRAKHLAVESLQPGRTAAAATVEVQRLATGDDSFVAQSDQPVRHAEMAVAASMAEGLLGEAAAQRTPGYLAEHLGPVPARLSERGAWVRLAGAAESLWRRLTGRALEREMQGPKMPGSQEGPAPVLGLLGAHERSRSSGRELGRGL
jgi:hypothetical protein